MNKAGVYSSYKSGSGQNRYSKSMACTVTSAPVLQELFWGTAATCLAATTYVGLAALYRLSKLAGRLGAVAEDLVRTKTRTNQKVADDALSIVSRWTAMGEKVAGVVPLAARMWLGGAESDASSEPPSP